MPYRSEVEAAAVAGLGAGGLAAGDAGHALAGADGTTSHLLELGAGGHLLGEQRGLNTVEQTFEQHEALERISQ